MLIKKHFTNGQDVVTYVKMTFEDAITELELQFYTDPYIARIEQMKYSNGEQSISVKDRGNKILTQYKTITNEEVKTG